MGGGCVNERVGCVGEGHLRSQITPEGVSERVSQWVIACMHVCMSACVRAGWCQHPWPAQEPDRPSSPLTTPPHHAPIIRMASTQVGEECPDPRSVPIVA